MDQHDIRARAGHADMNISPVHGHDLSLRRIVRLDFRFPQIRASICDDPQRAGRNRQDQDCRQHAFSEHGLSGALTMNAYIVRRAGSSRTVTF